MVTSNPTLRHDALRYVVAQSRSYLQILASHREELRLDGPEESAELLAAIDRAEEAVRAVNALGTEALRKER